MLFVAASCKGSENAGNKRPSVSEVTIVEIKPQEIENYYRTSGTIKANTTSEISSRVMGTVTSIEVKEGDKVNKDQLLLTIDDRDIRNKVSAAENRKKELSKALEADRENKKLMSITFDRYSNLYNEKAVSGQEMDEVATKKRLADIQYERAQAALEGAQANLEELKINLDFTKIKSPVNGIVTEKYIELGSTTVPGKPLLNVEDNSLFRLETTVGEQLHDYIEVGMPVPVHIDSINKDVTGLISEIVPAVDPETRTFLIKIDINDEQDLRSGLYAKALIPAGSRKAMLVPFNSVVEKGQLEGVYVVNPEGIVNYRLVRLGRRSGQQVEVLSGLKDGDRIIVDGIDNAVDGGVVNNNSKK
jgi:RND family efflux transporter MFP subunit